MQFPPLFAVAVPTATTAATAPIHDNRLLQHQQHQQQPPDRVSIYQATLIRDGPDRWGESPSIYLVAPYRIYHGTQDRQYPDDTYVSSGRRPPSWPRNDVMLLADAASTAASTGDTELHRRVIYQGPWEQSGFTVFSMYCGSSIPVLDFTTGTGTGPAWPPAYFNRLPLTPITQNQLRFWSHRWDPDTWPETRGPGPDPGPRAMSGGGGGGGAAPTATVPASRATVPITTVPITTVLPLFVAELVIHDAHNRGLTCPITLEPISPTQRTPLAVTPCYHVFTASALEAWFSVGDPSCPVCKSRCPNTLS